MFVKLKKTCLMYIMGQFEDGNNAVVFFFILLNTKEWTSKEPHVVLLSKTKSMLFEDRYQGRILNHELLNKDCFSY